MDILYAAGIDSGAMALTIQIFVGCTKGKEGVTLDIRVRFIDDIIRECRW